MLVVCFTLGECRVGAKAEGTVLKSKDNPRDVDDFIMKGQVNLGGLCFVLWNCGHMVRGAAPSHRLPSHHPWTKQTNFLLWSAISRLHTVYLLFSTSLSLKLLYFPLNKKLHWHFPKNIYFSNSDIL